MKKSSKDLGMRLLSRANVRNGRNDARTLFFQKYNRIQYHHKFYNHFDSESLNEMLVELERMLLRNYQQSIRCSILPWTRIHDSGLHHSFVLNRIDYFYYVAKLKGEFSNFHKRSQRFVSKTEITTRSWACGFFAIHCHTKQINLYYYVDKSY